MAEQLNSIGTLIRRRREELKMSAAELGRAVGVSSQAVHNWEKRLNGAPSRKKLLRTAEVLGLKPEELLASVADISATDERLLVSMFRGLDSQERSVVIRMLQGLAKK